MSRMQGFRVKIFADGADLDGMVKMAHNPLIQGFTTNPTLMRKAGVSDYETFARRVLAAITDRPVSFEVFADDFPSMAEQARAIANWGPIFDAEEAGCDIVTVPNEFLAKLNLVDKDLSEYSRETVQLFYKDATAAAYQIKTTRIAAE